MSLEPVSDAQLACAIEENLFALFRAMSALPGAEMVESDALSYHSSFPPAALFNGAWRSRFPASEADARIDAAMAWFAERDAPLVAWWFSQNSQPPEVYARLEARGFELDYNAPGMVIDSGTIREPLPLPEGFTIVEAADGQSLADWTTVLLAAYSHIRMSLESARVWEDATLALGAANVPWRLYVGYLDGRPAACNLLFNGAGVAGLFCIGTIPEVRGKGLSRPIILQPLLDARAAGYRYGVLFSSPMGLPVYEHLGFHRAGINIGRYLWHPE